MYKVKKVLGTKPYKNSVISQVLSEDDQVFDYFGVVTEGQQLECVIEKTQYGQTCKKVSSGGGGGQQRDPETQNYIIRQNAMGHAVERAGIIARLSLEFGGHPNLAKVLEEELGGKHLIQVATYIAKYAKGEVTVVDKPTNQPTQAQSQPHYEEPPIMDDSEIEQLGEHELDPFEK